MARSRLTDTTNDLISDAGAVLWSLILGEQQEFPVIINFLESVEGYTYEAILLEANNVSGQTTKPTTVKTDGIETEMTVRIPSDEGDWDEATAYDQGDVVLYENSYYELLSGSARVSDILPTEDPLWMETVLNQVYIQAPSTLGTNFTVAPLVNSAIYGFFELRVTEPTGTFPKTWKPVRGMIEFLYSPTEEV